MGVQVFGIEAPIIKEGDDIEKIVLESLKDYKLDNGDVIGITESVIARSQGNYVKLNDIVEFMKRKNYKKSLFLYSPIMSRNRFSHILRAFARFADNIIIALIGDSDEQGNPNYGINKYTGVDIAKFYEQICKEENCSLCINHYNVGANYDSFKLDDEITFIDCRCHPTKSEKYISLADIMNEPFTQALIGYNSEYGLLGSNMSDKETLKLFPIDCDLYCYDIQQLIKEEYDVDVEVMIFGDGCFKDPVCGIWEFADPVTSPGYTKGLEGCPNEIKLKYLIDSEYKHFDGDLLETAIDWRIGAVKGENKSGKNRIGDMSTQGTTPRRYVDLLASLMDLTTGSGMRKTPFVLVKNYFD